MTDRPVIGFLTDFGLDGAAATCRGVMLSIARDAQIVDVCHTVAKYAIADGAYLLAASLPWFPVGVHVGVVDPGVGTERRPVAILTARGDVLVGPDNGLLLPAAERLGGVVAARLIANPAWQLPVTSATFHGRDIFSPVAAHLALGEPFAEVGPEIDAAGLVRLEPARAVVDGDALGTRATYVDSFGNVRLAGGSADLVSALGALPAGTELALELEGGRHERVTWQRTFGAVERGGQLLYEDSAGNLAIAVANGNAAARLGLSTGDRVRVRRT
ncbi:MAG TPA: SAM-dependent chlorinase/fluorinase [Candidatus Dormibacteraeota bacterium]|nr:SAM-dependent chlorinase/fluorinase [Candidatus Dormibacteraeota bacterium]